MAQYKVLQDIEAEDKFLGPLTLKQFIFGAIAIVSCYLSFIFITKNLWVLAIPLFPVIVVMGFLAFPWGRDQPTETWLLAKIRFYFKPRKRVWNQVGIQELVKITAPPKVQQYFGDNLSQTEVKSRLQALATTIDSRGWAVKNVNVNMYADPNYSGSSASMVSDRLVEASSLPQVESLIDDRGISDMFDNPKAKQISTALSVSGQEHKTNTVEKMQDIVETSNSANQSGQAPDYWFMNQPEPSKKGTAMFGTQTVHPATDSHVLPQNFSSQSHAASPEESEILDEIHAHKSKPDSAFRNHKTIVPGDNKSDQNISTPSVTAPLDPVTIRLAGNNDRVVSSLAKETNKAHPELPDDEVIISLH